MLGELPVQGCPTNLDKSRARANCACSRCGCIFFFFGHFYLIYHFTLLSSSLWETAQYRLKYCLKGLLTQTNHPTTFSNFAIYLQEELLVSCIPKDLMTSMKEDLTRKMMSKIPRITPFHDLYVKHHSDVR